MDAKSKGMENCQTNLSLFLSIIESAEENEDKTLLWGNAAALTTGPPLRGLMLISLSGCLIPIALQKHIIDKSQPMGVAVVQMTFRMKQYELEKVRNWFERTKTKPKRIAKVFLPALCPIIFQWFFDSWLFYSLSEVSYFNGKAENAHK